MQVAGDCPKKILTKSVAIFSLSKSYPILSECVRNVNNKLVFDGSFHNTSLSEIVLFLVVAYGLNLNPVMLSLIVS